MRDINRIEPFIKILTELWLENPDLRFGQLIHNITYKVRTDGDIYNVEDNELLREIKIELFDSGFMKYLNNLDDNTKSKPKTLDEEFNVLPKGLNEYYKHPVEILSTNEVCDKCPNNIKNGGTGMCNCILGTPQIR